ncbi:hypothetical protein HMPREF1539_01287 [Fusobacterium nucleatum CTI-2]|uniref:hypothetical protein n=1 Tax=Fusobacterium nucleatum TaxID=851 RepID=UPI0003B80BE5|nr:hypothetical protein [Fusobacterium nucleatum]ERT42932.1 hypothetical protein HMPREF1539_01287 [Fusobacterium nucleatum CTI-2]
MTTILALVIVLVAMSLGDIVSIKTKAWIPSVFVTALIFLFGFFSKECYINSYFRNARSWIGNVSTSYSHGNIDEY